MIAKATWKHRISTQNNRKMRDVNRHCSGVCYALAAIAMRALAGGDASALYPKERQLKVLFKRGGGDK